MCYSCSANPHLPVFAARCGLWEQGGAVWLPQAVPRTTALQSGVQQGVHWIFPLAVFFFSQRRKKKEKT